MHNTLESPKSLFEVITLWSGECFGFSFSIVCSALPLRLKDLPLTLPLEMAFCLRRIRWRKTIAWEMQRVLSVLFPALSLPSGDDLGY